MFLKRVSSMTAGAGIALGLLSGAALGDSIDPLEISADLAVGESITVRKTVTISDAPPTDATVDVMFLIDTTGSMSAAIAGAKAAASSIITGLGALGSLETGAGFYNDPSFNGVQSDLNADETGTIATLNSYFASGGGDFPEEGNAAILDAALNADWRDGSNRYIIVLGDSNFLDNPATGQVADATVISALEDKNINLIGLRFLDYNCISFPDADSLDCDFTEAIESLGGTSYDTGSSPDEITDAILDGIVASFDEYSTVSVSDLGGGLPEILVSSECVSADIGDCVGSDAVGDYDRTTTRTFEFDVTFTRLADGDTTFPTFALVDGGVVAREIDTFGGDTSVVPLPAAGWLLIGGLGALGAMKRRKKAA